MNPRQQHRAAPLRVSPAVPQARVRAHTGFDQTRRTLDDYLAKAAEARKRLLDEPYDPKRLHAWRVNLRRVTATLGELAALSDDDLHDVLGYLRGCREATGQCRDIDILAQETLPAFLDKEHGKLADASAVRAALSELQQHNHQRAVAALKKHSLATPQRAWRHWVQVLEPPSDKRIKQVAAEAIEQRLSELHKRAGKLDGGQKRLHRLRSATKKLRYSIELYQHAFPKQAAQAWLKRLSDLQGHLGLAHDRMMGRKLIELVVNGAGAKAQLKAFRRWSKRTAYEASEQALQSLAKLNHLKPYWRQPAH